MTTKKTKWISLLVQSRLIQKNLQVKPLVWPVKAMETFIHKKSCIRETPTLYNDADSSTDTIKFKPTRNTSLFLRPHAGTIHNSIPEHFLVFKAPREDNPQIQSGKRLVLRLHTEMIQESNTCH